MHQKRAIVLMVLTLCCLLGTNAADLSDPSNTANTTNNIFPEVKDIYLSPLYYSLVNDTLVFMQFDLPGSTGPTFGDIQLGAGLNLAGNYYSARYEGSNYILGNLAGNESYSEDNNTVLLVNGNNQIIGKQETFTINQNYTDYNVNYLTCLVGLQLESMYLGISNYLAQNSTVTYRQNAPDAALFINGTAASTVYTVKDSTGTLIYNDVDRYGLGTTQSSYLTELILAGIRMKMEENTLYAHFGIVARFGKYASSATREIYTQQPGAGFAAYTPAAALEGNEAVALNDISTYTYQEANTGNDYTTLTASLGAVYEMPFQLFGSPGILKPGLSYDLSIPLYSNRYRDSSGTVATASGTASYYYEIIHTPQFAGDPDVTQTSTTRFYHTETISEGWHWITPSATMTLEPASNLELGLSLSPVIYFAAQNLKVAEQQVTATLLHSVDPTDPYTDQLSTTTETYAGRETQENFFTLNLYLNTAARFYLIPEKLRINLGASMVNNILEKRETTLKASGITTTITTVKINENDPVVTSSSIDPDVISATADFSHNIEDTGNAANVTYKLGFTYFFNPNMFLDFSMNGSGGDIWNSNTWTMEMTVKLPPNGDRKTLSGNEDLSGGDEEPASSEGSGNDNEKRAKDLVKDGMDKEE